MSASGTTNEPSCYTLPLAGYPGINPFVLDWLRGNSRFLPRGEREPRRDRRIAPDFADALIASNQRWGLFVQDDVTRWATGNTVTIVAGQQVGFAGGPLYTLAKLASLVKMKREYEARGIAATVFFWLATEDHDYNEVATLSLPVKGRQLDLVQLRATHGVESKRIVGSLPIPEALTQELLALYAMDRPQWLREGITFRDSFAELIATAFPRDVVLIDALLPELRRAGAPLFEQLAAREAEVQREIAAKSWALSEAGFAPQVVARDGETYTLLFRLDADGNRTPFDGTAANPETISTSTLTRPLLQDFVLQPDVFVGGPAEVAYYAQIAGLHELLNIAMPRVALRGHALVAPRRVARLIERFDIDPVDVFSSADSILAEREPAGVAAVNAITEEAKRDLFAAIDKIRELALPADHALARSIHRSIGHLDYHFNKLSERAVRGLVRKDRERWTAVRELVATLYPDRHVQDRVVGWFAYWCDFGPALVDRLVDEIEPDAPSFKIVSV